MKAKLTLREQLFRLEDRLLQPEVRQSKEEIAKLLADDFVEFGSSGRIFNKTQVLEGLPDSPITSMTIEDFQIRCLSDDVALITYRVVKTNELRVEMRNSLRSSIWKFIDGRWQMVFHQGTRCKGENTDMPLNLKNVPLRLSLTVNILMDVRNEEQMAALLLELHRLMLNKDINIDQYTLRLEEPVLEMSKPGNGSKLYLENFPAESITDDQESLASFIREHQLVTK